MRSVFPSTISRSIVSSAALATLLSSAACSSQPAKPAAPPVSADAWATVDGREIKQADVDKAYRRMQDADVVVSQEEMLTAKLNLLNDLIVQDLLFAKANALKIEVPQADLDTAYNNAKNNIPDAAFQQELLSCRCLQRVLQRLASFKRNSGANHSG